MKHVLNETMIKFWGRQSNEGYARVAVAAFISQLDPTVEELSDVKTAVSEAIMNAIFHGYPSEEGIITIKIKLYTDAVEISINDKGIGIENIDLARQPLFTSKPQEEFSGMGFTVMESFMDKIKVRSHPKKGTTIKMYKVFPSLSDGK